LAHVCGGDNLAGETVLGALQEVCVLLAQSVGRRTELGSWDVNMLAVIFMLHQYSSVKSPFSADCWNKGFSCSMWK